MKEIEDPELASLRARELYEAKGYSQAWIEKRLRSIKIRGALTKEWKERGVQEGREYANRDIRNPAVTLKVHGDLVYRA